MTFLADQGTRVLILGILIGLAVPPLAAFLRPAVGPTVLVVLAGVLLRVDWRDFFGYLRRPGLAAVITVWLLLVTPVIVWLVTGAIEMSPGLRAALVLMACTPSISASPALAILIGLDVPLALVVTLVTVFAAPLSLPPIALGLLGLELTIGVGELMIRLTILVGGAFALMLLVRLVVPGERLKANARSVDGVLVLVIALFGTALMDGVTALLFERPSFVLTLAAVSFVANFGLQALGAAAFAWTRARGAFTAGLLSGNRNLAILIAVLPAGTDPTILFYFVIAQVPMYFAPAIVLPVYRRFSRNRA